MRRAAVDQVVLAPEARRRAVIDLIDGARQRLRLSVFRCDDPEVVQTLADAVRRVRPFGIDVSSGVERSPGVKDEARMKALFQSVGEAMSTAPHEGARIL